MTSWTRKRIEQHKELLSNKKYKKRVVPLEKKERLEQARQEEIKQEIEEVLNVDTDGISE